MKDIAKQLSGQGHSLHLSWIESHATAAGFPDVDYCCYGVCGELELKAGPDLEVRATQVAWFEERIEAGGYPLFFVQWGDVYMFVPGVWAADIRRDPCLENIMHRASTIWAGQIPPGEFLKRLRNPKNEYGKSAERLREESE